MSKNRFCLVWVCNIHVIYTRDFTNGCNTRERERKREKLGRNMFGEFQDVRDVEYRGSLQRQVKQERVAEKKKRIDFAQVRTEAGKNDRCRKLNSFPLFETLQVGERGIV